MLVKDRAAFDWGNRLRSSVVMPPSASSGPNATALRSKPGGRCPTGFVRNIFQFCASNPTASTQVSVCSMRKLPPIVAGVDGHRAVLLETARQLVKLLRLNSWLLMSNAGCHTGWPLIDSPLSERQLSAAAEVRRFFSERTPSLHCCSSLCRAVRQHLAENHTPVARLKYSFASRGCHCRDAKAGRGNSGRAWFQFNAESARKVSTARSMKLRTFCVARQPSWCTTCTGSAAASKSSSTICNAPDFRCAATW